MAPNFARRKSIGKLSIPSQVSDNSMPRRAPSDVSAATPATATATTTTTTAITTTAPAKKPSKMKRLITMKSLRRKNNGVSASAMKTLESDDNDGDPNRKQPKKKKHPQQMANKTLSSGTPAVALEELCTRLQTDLEIRDRKYHLKMYTNCFVGSELVDYLIENKLAPSRPKAAEIGQEMLAALGAFEHVTKVRNFHDDYLFYRFASDDPKAAETVPNYRRLASTGDRSVSSSASGAIVKMDKYGFLLEDERCVSECGGDGGNLSSRIGALDARRWENILVRVPNSKSLNQGGAGSTTQSKVKYYTRRGLPDRLRQKAWTALTGVDLIMNENTGVYDALVERAEEEYRDRHDLDSDGDQSDASKNSGSLLNETGKLLETIERDIRRTFPKHFLFHTVWEDDNDNEQNTSHNGSSQNGGSEYGGSVADSELAGSDDDFEDESDIGSDDITEIAESTGQDPAGVVEAKKQLFNQSMNLSMRMSPMSPDGRLQNVDGIESAQMEGIKNGDDLRASFQNKPLGSDGSDHSVEFHDGDEGEMDDKFCDDSARESKSSSQRSEALGMGHGQGALRRILRAYCMYDSEVGYCQGMNFITAMFLTFLSEEEAFWLLVVVMNEEPYKLRELFGEDMAGTHEVLYIAEKLMDQFLPRLSKHLEEETIHVSMFVTQWLLTVYTSTFPFDLVARVWDSFLVEGWKVVYRVMLSLLEHVTKDILELQFEQILAYFRELPKTVNGQVIMAGSLKIPLKRKHIQKHVNEWRRHSGVKEPVKEEDASSKFERRDSEENESIISGNSSSLNSDLSFARIGVRNPTNILRKTPKEIEVIDLSETLLPIIGRKKFAVLIHNVLNPEECSELIDQAEESGFEDASIYDRRTNRAHRNCTRYMAEDIDLAEHWFERITQALVGTRFENILMSAPWMGGDNIAGKERLHYRAVSLNERMRLLKYKQDQFFHSHNDTVFVRGPDAGERAGETSSISVHIYLNHKFKGGNTTFQGRGRHLDVKPKTGSVLLFEHQILHEGQIVTQGKKYIVRTDIMYSTTESVDFESPSETTLTQNL